MLFASDLDNTLIYSYKAAKAGDICVERKDGKELSFMSPEAHALLKDVAERCAFVPVTTRSLSQYRRLDLGVKLRYAIVANGALLLVDGVVDEQWTAQTRKLLDATLPEIEADNLLFDVRYVDEAFIFCKSEHPRQAMKYLQTIIDGNKFNVCGVGDKVYIFPRFLDKGTAVKRLMERVPALGLICAGDSELDLPMLEIADIPIAPQSLGLRRGCTPAAETFTTEALRAASEILARRHPPGWDQRRDPC